MKDVNKKPPLMKRRGLEEKMDIPPKILTYVVPEIKFEDNPKDDAYEDYKEERLRLKRILAIGDAILEIALDDMATERNAKDIEAASNLIKNICSASDKIFDLHKTIRNLKPRQIEEAETIEEKDEEKDDKTNNLSADIGDILEAENNLKEE